LSAIIRNSEVMIPNQKSEILINDQLLVFAKPNEIKEIESLFK